MAAPYSNRRSPAGYDPRFDPYSPEYDPAMGPLPPMTPIVSNVTPNTATNVPDPRRFDPLTANPHTDVTVPGWEGESLKPNTSAPSSWNTYGQGGGAWNANYEWVGEGRPGDLLNRSGGDDSRLTGFNTAGWGTGERGTESSKNTFGMIARHYETSDAGITALLADPDFRRFFPNARRVDVDKIDFGDGMPVDVIRNYDKATGRGDAWAYQPPGGASAARRAAPSPTNPAVPPVATPTVPGARNMPVIDPVAYEAASVPLDLPLEDLMVWRANRRRTA